MPRPKKYERKDKFISRCIPELVSEKRKPNQSAAICYSIYNRRNKFNTKELEKGIQVELEHTSSKSVAEKIAKEHLAEIPDYYTRLIKMKKKALKK